MSVKELRSPGLISLVEDVQFIIICRVFVTVSCIFSGFLIPSSIILSNYIYIKMHKVSRKTIPQTINQSLYQLIKHRIFVKLFSLITSIICFRWFFFTCQPFILLDNLFKVTYKLIFHSVCLNKRQFFGRSNHYRVQISATINLQPN